jgi:hypothetical protein
MNHIGQVMNKYFQSSPQDKNFSEKYGALLLLGNLSLVLVDSASYKNSLEEMITNHIMTEFNNPFGLLRARAIWVFGKYYNVKYQNIDGLFKVITC